MIIKLLIGLMLILFFCAFPGCTRPVSTTFTPPVSTDSSAVSPKAITELPGPRLRSAVSLEESLESRRSIREYSSSPLSLADVSQLLWAAQGITSENGGRTAPSAGALYPLEVYLIAGNVEGLPSGVYRYRPQGHELEQLADRDIRMDLAAAALGQTPIRDGAISIVISANYSKMMPKYGDRGIIYAQMETGHAAQNILLQATALDLGAVTIGAFDDSRVKTLIGLSESENPLYIIPVGMKK